MATLLTRKEIEEIHAMLRLNFNNACGANSWKEPVQRGVTATATAALALLEADKRLREMDEEPGKISKLPGLMPGKP